MESPPSTSIWSETFILSDDSGLLLTSGSISSGSMSGESRSCYGHCPLEYQDSDCDKSLSQVDSLDGMSDIICGENFNTLKKGPHWSELKGFPIDPPLEFQDKPNVYDTFAEELAVNIIDQSISTSAKQFRLGCRMVFPKHQFIQRTYWMPEFLPFSPCHGARPSSRSSFGSSRLSSSHNSLSVPTALRVDDSSFITQAVSHDTLSSNQISDLYNVPFDSDVYAVPIDSVRPMLRPRKALQQKKKRRNTSSGFRDIETRQTKTNKKISKSDHLSLCARKSVKRHSVAGTSTNSVTEPVHMTLQEVRQYLQTLYSGSSDSSEYKEKIIKRSSTIINNNITINNNKFLDNNLKNTIETKRSTFLINIKNKKVKDSCENIAQQQIQEKRCKRGIKTFSIKQALCNLFRFRRVISPEPVKNKKSQSDECNNIDQSDMEVNKNISRRALPPLPGQQTSETDSNCLDFATSICKVKDYGWYWGPLSSESAEKILSNEPDGSFIVRDSSDDHYIFSLTFKLNNSVRHVRIEHDQGNFCFGSCTKFKSQTIVEFIENAVEHSRSGRYLFFLHRRPTIGPVRVQLLHPVSRFKQIQSLQHMCRFVILKRVRRDLVTNLPLPRRMIDYLSTAHYYSEHLIDIIEVDDQQRRHHESSEEYESDVFEQITRQS